MINSKPPAKSCENLNFPTQTEDQPFLLVFEWKKKLWVTHWLSRLPMTYKLSMTERDRVIKFKFSHFFAGWSKVKTIQKHFFLYVFRINFVLSQVHEKRMLFQKKCSPIVLAHIDRFSQQLHGCKCNVHKIVSLQCSNYLDLHCTADIMKYTLWLIFSIN